MEKVEVVVLFKNGVEKVYTTGVEEQKEVKELLDLIQEFYRVGGHGQVTLPNIKGDEISIIDLANTMSVTISKENLF